MKEEKNKLSKELEELKVLYSEHEHCAQTINELQTGNVKTGNECAILKSTVEQLTANLGVLQSDVESKTLVCDEYKNELDQVSLFYFQSTYLN